MCKAFCFTHCFLGDVMFEKDLTQSLLLDVYGDILPERKRTVLEMYYNEDFSLAEIADEIGISRQGVRDIIKKTETELHFLEEKLGLAQKFRDIQHHTERLKALLGELKADDPVKQELDALANSVK